MEIVCGFVFADVIFRRRTAVTQKLEIRLCSQANLTWEFNLLR